MNIKAKMKVSHVEENKSTDGQTKYGELVVLNAVYSEDPQSENYSFSQATPSATVSLFISNPSAYGAFEVDKEYYVDFSPAE